MQENYHLLVTRYFEYLVSNATCTGVRDRGTGEWFNPHYALGNPVSLVPTASRHSGVCWDVQIQALGCQVTVGPLLRLEKPSAECIGSSRPPPLPRVASRALGT